MDNGIQIIRHIPNKYYPELELAEYVIGVSQQKNTNTIIQKLKQILPKKNEKDDDGYFFLKKVKKIPQTTKVKILLCLNTKQQQPYRQRINEEMGNIIQDVVVEKLPKKSPLTKIQFKLWEKYWPINYVEPYIAKQIKHTTQEKQFIHKLINIGAKFYLFDNKQQILFQVEEGRCQEGSIEHPVMRMLEQWPLSQAFGKQQYYYLTNLKMLVQQQICGMCAMALVHSRLHSIYIANLQISETLSEIMFCEQINHKVIMLRVEKGVVDV